MTIPHVLPAAAPPSTDGDFVYGRRTLIRYDKTGQPIYTWQPLQPADFLAVRDGDEFVHPPAHDALVRRLRRTLRFRYRYNPATLVLSGVPIVWAETTLGQPAPDLAVVFAVAEPTQPRTVFAVAVEGVCPRLILEVTSPHFAEFDRVEKVRIYAQAGVEEYFILDVGESQNDEVNLLGYQLTAEGYKPLIPDARGWLHSGVLRCWLGRDFTTGEIVLVDGRSGQPIVPDADFEDGLAEVRAAAAFRAHSIATQLILDQQRG
jgi:Uma2 family endonuclease